MKEENVNEFLIRIDRLKIDGKPTFGKMNANQMICHCADFFRMAIGTKMAEEYGKVNPDEIRSMAKSGKPIPSPKGFGQIEGGGTKSTTFENDKNILKEYLLDFSKFSEDFEFAPHPYFGNMDYKRWVGLAIYHLNHHLGQFKI